MALLCFSCPHELLPLGVGLAIGLGIASHLLYFIHGELNKQGGAIVIFFITAYCILISLFMLICDSASQASLFATIVFASYQLVLGLSIAAYRLLLHRTCRFPGGKLAALSKWRNAFIAHKTQRYHAELRRLHTLYGDVVRTGPRELSINNFHAIEKIYGGRSGCLKGPWYDMGGTGHNLHRTRDPILHARQRPLWERGFREMSNHIPKIISKTSDLVSSLRLAGSDVDVVTEFELFAFKLMAFISFSQDIDKEPRWALEASESYERLRESQRAIGTYGHVPWLYSIAQKFPLLIPENGIFTRLATRMIDDRRKVVSFNYYPYPDNRSLKSKQITPEDFQCLGKLDWPWSLAERSGNVSSAMTSLCFYLATNSNALEQLQKEVDPLLESGSFNPKGHHAVLNSIMLESFRLQPLVPNGGERVSPPQGLQIGDIFIPGNCVVKVPSYTIFRDERYFARPDQWIPERWTSQTHLVKNRAAFIPFSTGQYSCVGRPLGLVEISLVIAHLVHNFTPQLSQGQSPHDFEESGQDHFGMVFRPGSLRLNFLPRWSSK